MFKKDEIIKELKWRGIVNNITDEQKFLNIVNSKEKSSVYIGFDPSFKSLHLGNFVALRILEIFKKYGWETIALVGGATGMIGDPSGKSKERNLLDKSIIKDNIINIEKQIQKISNVDYILNNADWTNEINIIDFLRNLGKDFQINRMLEKENVKSRLENGISFTEFCYPILQSNDWHYMYNKYSTYIQCGGSDQWGNITSGTELIRKRIGTEHKAVGITINLLTKKDGKKFGKSESGAIYLDEKITDPFQMYQFFINQKDEDLDKLFMYLSDYEKEEIKKIIKKHLDSPKKRYGQMKLCENIMTKIHSESTFKTCKRLAKILYEEKYYDMSEEDLIKIFEKQNIIEFKKEDLSFVNFLTNLNIFKSKREIREFINSEAIKINGQVIIFEEDSFLKFPPIAKNYYLIKKGKKNFYLVKLV